MAAWLAEVRVITRAFLRGVITFGSVFSLPRPFSASCTWTLTLLTKILGAPATDARHVCPHRGLVHKDQALGLDEVLASSPAQAEAGHLWPALWIAPGFPEAVWFEAYAAIRVASSWA